MIRFDLIAVPFQQFSSLVKSVAADFQRCRRSCHLFMPLSSRQTRCFYIGPWKSAFGQPLVSSHYTQMTTAVSRHTVVCTFLFTYNNAIFMHIALQNIWNGPLYSFVVKTKQKQRLGNTTHTHTRTHAWCSVIFLLERVFTLKLQCLYLGAMKSCKTRLWMCGYLRKVLILGPGLDPLFCGRTITPHAQSALLL